MAQPITILLLEDSPLDAELTLEELRIGGIECESRRVETRDGFESALTQQVPDVILSDYSLPDFDGISALKIARGRCPDVPFVFVSGVIGEEVAIESLKFGATDYVLKHRLERLLPAVNRALVISRERQERREAQEALRRSEERLRLAVDIARLGTWDLEPGTRALEASPICKEQFGVPLDAPFTYETLYTVIHYDDREEVRTRIESALDKGAPYAAEYRVVWPDQSVHWIVAQGQTVRNADGAVSRMLSVTLDITSRKQFEENLARQTRQLTDLNADLSQFAYAASHDLQEPLRMITSYSQLLIKGYTGPVGAESALCVKYITEGTARMRELLAALLSYTRLTAGGQQGHETVDLNAVLAKVLANLRTVIADTSATVTVDTLPVVHGYEAHFIQLFQNLIDNAIKYRGAEPPRIHISATGHEGQWQLAIADNGIGIDPQYHNRVFGVFKRLHDRAIPGTGIGLAICQRVVERYGGRIWVESQDGNGSTFFVTLPAVDGEMP